MQFDTNHEAFLVFILTSFNISSSSLEIKKKPKICTKNNEKVQVCKSHFLKILINSARKKMSWNIMNFYNVQRSLNMIKQKKWCPCVCMHVCKWIRLNSTPRRARALVLVLKSSYFPGGISFLEIFLVQNIIENFELLCYRKLPKGVWFSSILEFYFIPLKFASGSFHSILMFGAICSPVSISIKPPYGIWISASTLYVIERL